MKSEIRYEDYQKLIYKMGHKFAQKSHIPLEDLISDGHEVFCKCQISYNPEMGSFITYFWKCFNQDFLNKLKKNQQNTTDIETIPISCKNPSPEHYCIFKNMMAQMSEDAKFICQIILETPLDLIEQIKSKNKKHHSIFKNDIKKYITTKYNWIPWRCEKAFAEIGGLFQ